MPLKISLKPGEKFAINGAVITNGDRRTSMVLQNKASILRERDIMQQDDANTPARRIYFPIMMMYLDQDNVDTYYQEFTARLEEFMDTIKLPAVVERCVIINKEVANQNYYSALKTCQALFEFEEKLLAS